MIARFILDALATRRTIQTLAARYGLRPRGFARQFVAGSTIDDAIAAARRIAAAGPAPALEYLGAPVRSMADADSATRTGIAIVNAIAAADAGATLIVRLTDLGLTIDRATCVDNLRRVLDPAAARQVFLWIDMEDSRYTQVTLDVFHTVWQQDYRAAGLTLQAYLPRSADDAQRLTALGARVRLVRGHYREPRRVAYRSKAQIDRAFLSLAGALIDQGRKPAVATDDPALVDRVKTLAAARDFPLANVEFHLPFEGRADLAAGLHAAGAAVRVVVPFGPGWFPYVMRRLGDRPSDLGRVLRSVASFRPPAKAFTPPTRP